MEVVRFLEDSGLLRNGFTQTIENETKKQICRFFGTFLRPLREVILLGEVCFGFIDFMLKCKNLNLTVFTNLFSIKSFKNIDILTNIQLIIF